METTSVVKIVSVQNQKGCMLEPSASCARVCQAVVQVPEDNPPDLLWIQQRKDDTAPYVVVNVEGVTLKDFKMRGGGGNWWDLAGPTIELNMKSTTTQGDMYITLDTGKANLQGCKHMGTVDVRSSGSVIMRDVDHEGPAKLVWRQPNNQLCTVTGPGQLVLPDEIGAFGLCDSMYYQSGFQAYYDTSKDFFLDRAEFSSQLSKMPYCCGGSCPHASYCDSLLFKIFPFGSAEGGADFSGRGEILSAASVWKNLKAAGLSGMVPYCFREAKLLAPINGDRVPEGWPIMEPWAGAAPSPGPLVFASCTRNAECQTGYCDSTGTGTCRPHPSVSFSEVHGNWSICDKPCGGGEQVRAVVCLGSDGLAYPMSLCPLLSLSQEVKSCNTQACDLPLPVTNASFGLDQDLRKSWIGISVSARLPDKATSMELRLGSPSGYMAATSVDDVEAADCTDRICHLKAEVELPAYVDRIMIIGVNSDGIGEAALEVFADRVGSAEGRSHTFKLQSEAGMVRFHLKGASPSSGTWAPADRLPGIRLHAPDAKFLMKTVGPNLGNPESVGHGLVVIDSVAVPGIPAARWIYTTRPVYLALDPAHLNFLSAGLLTPTMYNYRVSFVDLSCSFESENIPTVPTDADFEREDVQTRFVAMYQQLEKALRSDGWASDQKVRGELLLLGPGHRPKPFAPRYWMFYEASSDGVVSMKLRERGELDQLEDTALWLSMIVGILVSLTGTLVFYKTSRKALTVKNRDKRAAKALLNKKLGEDKEKKGKDDDNALEDLAANPFHQPLLLIDMLVMEPILRHLFDSLARFCRERLVVITEKDNEEKQTVIVKLEGSDPTPVTTEHASPPVAPTAAWEPKGKCFLYMRRFRSEYERFCIERGLESHDNRDAIMRNLVDWYDVRSVRETVWRVRGVRWKELPGTTCEEEPVNNLLQFCNEHIEVTGNRRSDWIDVKNNRLPNGKMQIGIRKRYMDWCMENGCEPVKPGLLDPLDDNGAKIGMQSWAMENKVSFQEVETQRILNCYLTRETKVVFSWRILLADFVQVCIHLGVLLSPAILIVVHAIHSQQVYAKTMATGDAIELRDFFGTFLPYIGFDDGGRQVMLACSIVLATQFVYFVLAIVRVLIHYVSAKQRLIKRMYDIIFAGVLFVETIGVMTWVGVTGAWCILATILTPTKYLPYGSAVVVFCFVVIALFKELTVMAQAMEKKVWAVIDARLQSVLRQIADGIEDQMHEQAVKALRLRKDTGGVRIGIKGSKDAPLPMKVDESNDGFKDFNKAKKSRKITPADVFDALDKDQTGFLSISEFRLLFNSMQGEMDALHIDKMFAFADADGSRDISQEEFVKAWSCLVQNIVSKVMADVGFSSVDILVAVLSAVTMLICFFMFIFFAMQGWYNDTSLQACVQSALVAGSGKVVTVVRKRAPGEGAADVQTLVNQAVDGGDGGDGDGDGDGGDGDGGDGDGGGDGGG
eukprot:TRINITY_DN7622_c0_g1_i1.p1 TRINITY_DN7622_c0_g1~~TRINITY_DN7622_c0_g1_i1.p1  ORF type:complete len:1578 (+),score=278.16 TRINITY_DN7622_c0_g1_i1:344-4735(+)